MPARFKVHRLLPPLPTTGLADAVEQRLADAIELGLLHPGEQLPSESQLAAQLGVATVTLREALSALRQQGLVETRRGRNGGTFVCGPQATSVSRLRRRLRAKSVIELRDLGDEWSAVAGTAARLAATRSSAAQVMRLRDFAGRLASAESIGDRTRAHSRFFIESALAAQSERLTRSEVRIQSEIGDLLWFPGERPVDTGEIAGSLEAIAAAIAEEDPVNARDLAEAHVRRALRALTEARLVLSDEDAER